MPLQYGRALALLRAPIWQSSWREAALPGASLAQTCLVLGCLSRKEQAAGAWESPLAPFLTQLQSCLAFALRSQSSLRRA